MQYHHTRWMKRFNKLGVLITSFLVTVISVVSKLQNIVYLILSVRFSKSWFSIFLNELCTRSVIAKIPWSLTMKESSDLTTVDLTSAVVDQLFSLIATMAEVYYLVLGADFSLLEHHVRLLTNREAIYTDGNSCLFPLPLETRASNQISLVTVQLAGLSPDRPSTLYE